MTQDPPFEDNPFSDQPEAPAIAKPPYPAEVGDGTGGLIPVKNPAALIGYYLGVFSAIPCFGLLLAVPALIMGIIGLRNCSRNPVIKGKVHAWIAIIAGILFTLLWGGLIVVSVVAAFVG